MVKCIGVMNGGGDCPGLNAVLRGVVKTAMVKYGYEVIGFRDGFNGLVLNRFIRFKPGDVSGILDKGGTILGTSDRDDPFNFRIDRDGKTSYADMSDRILENVDMHDIDAMVMIGGQNTMDAARKLARKGLKVVGVPKSIDNDLTATDRTFGYMTAVETATEAIDKLHSTAESHHRVMILEVLGRYTGWIALEAGIAGGADVIIIPEIPYDLNKIARKVLERKNAGKSFSIIVVAEGARAADGKPAVHSAVVNNDDPIKLGGIGNILGDQLEKLTGIDTRVTVLGYLQRGGRPVPYDRILSTRFGVEAVELVHEGKFGTMVSLNGNTITHVSLEEAAIGLNTVDPQGELVRLAKSVGVSFGD